MKKMKSCYLLFLIVFLAVPSVYGLPAFPGAMGMGADTVGGRGGVVYTVTNLNDSGSGSLRAAVEANGARIVVFAVSGRIDLESRLTIVNPYLTIAGQTSPGGILITGEKIRIINTHDIVIRHLRLKPGYSNAGDDDADMDALQIWGDASHYSSTDSRYHSYNIVIDHCSISDTMDEILDTAYTTYDITLSNNLFYGAWRNPSNVNGDRAEGNHNRGPLLWGKYNSSSHLPHISYWGNVHISLESRVPEINFNSYFDIQNNISYDVAGGRAPKVCQSSSSYDMKGNFINNYTLPGPTTNSGTGTLHGCLAMNSESLYVSGNTGCDISGGSAEWCVGEDDDSNGAVELLPINRKSESLFVTTGISGTGILVVTSPLITKSNAQAVVDMAGATKPKRDSDDIAFTACFKNETSCVFEGVRDFTTDLPTYTTVNDNPTDSDNDGMPDSWENSYGLNPNMADDHLYTLSSRYTNIEIYIDALAGDLLPAMNVKELQ